MALCPWLQHNYHHHRMSLLVASYEWTLAKDTIEAWHCREYHTVFRKRVVSFYSFLKFRLDFSAWSPNDTTAQMQQMRQVLANILGEWDKKYVTFTIGDVHLRERTRTQARLQITSYIFSCMPLNRGSRMTFYCRAFSTHQTLVTLTKSIRDLEPKRERETAHEISNYVTIWFRFHCHDTLLRLFSFRRISISFLAKVKSVHCDSIVCWTDSGSTSFWWNYVKPKNAISMECALFILHTKLAQCDSFRMFQCFSFLLYAWNEKNRHLFTQHTHSFNLAQQF